MNIVGNFPGCPMAKIPSFQRRGLGSILVQGVRSYIPQLIVLELQLKVHHSTVKTEDPTAVAKTWHRQINKMNIDQNHLRKKMDLNPF